VLVVASACVAVWYATSAMRCTYEEMHGLLVGGGLSCSVDSLYPALCFRLWTLLDITAVAAVHSCRVFCVAV
jgi:hypothetical protein